MVLEKALESLLDFKEIEPVNPKGNQPRLFIGRTDTEAPILWPPGMKSWLIGKAPDAGKDWRQEEKGKTDGGWDGWMASLTQWTWVWAQEDSEGQGCLVCCSPWVTKSCIWVSDWTTTTKFCSPCVVWLCSFGCVKTDFWEDQAILGVVMETAQNNSKYMSLVSGAGSLGSQCNWTVRGHF